MTFRHPRPTQAAQLHSEYSAASARSMSVLHSAGVASPALEPMPDEVVTDLIAYLLHTEEPKREEILRVVERGKQRAKKERRKEMRLSRRFGEIFQNPALGSHAAAQSFLTEMYGELHDHCPNDSCAWRLPSCQVPATRLPRPSRSHV